MVMDSWYVSCLFSVICMNSCILIINIVLPMC